MNPSKKSYKPRNVVRSPHTVSDTHVKITDVASDRFVQTPTNLCYFHETDSHYLGNCKGFFLNLLMKDFRLLKTNVYASNVSLTISVKTVKLCPPAGPVI